MWTTDRQEVSSPAVLAVPVGDGRGVTEEATRAGEREAPGTGGEAAWPAPPAWHPATATMTAATAAAASPGRPAGPWPRARPTAIDIPMNVAPYIATIARLPDALTELLGVSAPVDRAPGQN
jgi:hypothetical protein